MTVLRLSTPHSPLQRPRQRNSRRQRISQGNFSGSQLTATIPAGLEQLRQRVAANSLRLRGREFVRPAQGNVSTLAGNSQGRQGIGASAVTRMPMSPVGLSSVDLSLTGRILMAQ
jgi:hypothetical protein